MKKPTGYWQKLAYARSKQVSKLKKELKKEVQEKWHFRNALVKAQSQDAKYLQNLTESKYMEDNYKALLLKLADLVPGWRVHGFKIIPKE